MNSTRIAATTLGMIIAGHAVASPQFFDWEVRGTFTSVGSIGGIAIDGREFVISGQTTSALSASPWIENPITAPLDLSTLSLTFDGGDIGATPETVNLFTYGLLGTDAAMKPEPIFRFNESGDFQADTPFDSIVLHMNFGGIDAWVGFGGQGGKRLGITTALTDEGVIDFSEGSILQQLDQNGNTRSFTFVPAPAASVIMIAALGGLATRRRRDH